MTLRPAANLRMPAGAHDGHRIAARVGYPTSEDGNQRRHFRAQRRGQLLVRGIDLRQRPHRGHAGARDVDLALGLFRGDAVALLDLALELIAATFNLVRDSAKYNPVEYQENLSALAAKEPTSDQPNSAGTTAMFWFANAESPYLAGCCGAPCRRYAAAAEARIAAQVDA